MKKLILFLIILLASTKWSNAQFGKINITEPKVMISNGEDFAVLTYRKQGFSGGLKWRWHKATYSGKLKFLGWKLFSGSFPDSTSAVAAITESWDETLPPCLYENYEPLAIWTVTGDTLKARIFDDKMWLTQSLQPEPDAFVLRGKNMLYYSNITLITGIDSSCYANFEGGETGIGGLDPPSGFETPIGYQAKVSTDQTPYYIVTGGELVQPDDDDDGEGTTPPTNTAAEQFYFTPQQDVVYNSNLTVNHLKADWEVTTTGNRIYLKDNNWDTGFDTGATRRVFFGTESNTTAAARNLSNLEVTDLAGFDIAPLIIYEEQKYTQSLIHIKADPTKSRRILEQGALTYYWMPPSYEPSNSMYPNYYKTFPDFTLPNNKIAYHEFQFEDDYILNESDKKGFTYSSTKAPEYNAVYDYENWATFINLPPAYSDDVLRQSRWDAASETDIKNSFNSLMINQNSWRGVTTMNFEVLIGLDYDDQKLINVLSEWTAASPHSELAIWGKGLGGVNVNRIIFESTTDASKITPDLKYTGDYYDWLGDRHNNGTSIFGGRSYIFHAIPTIFYANDGYQTRPNNQGWIHQAVCAFIINKKFFPDKKVIINDAINSEYGLSGELIDRVHVYDEDNAAVYAVPSKMLVSPGQRFTRSAFAHMYMDGSDIWSEPWEVTDDPYYYGSDIYDVDGYLLPNRFKNNGSGRSQGNYFRTARSYRGLDWHVAGMWAASKNKDIIEADTEWNFVDFSTDNGATWVTGDNCLPSETWVDKKPIVLFKKSADNEEGLLLFFNPFQDATKQQYYKFRVDTTVYDVFQIGDYASVARVDLEGGVAAPDTSTDLDTGEPADDNFVANESIGKIGYIYGADDVNGVGYNIARNGMAGGVAKFNFYGNPSPTYPALQDSRTAQIQTYTADYSVFHLPSHSVTYDAAKTMRPKVHYKIFDESDNLILEVYDTKSGEAGSDVSNKRANNHPDNCIRWIKKGTYKIWCKNISTDGSTIRFNVGTTANQYNILDTNLEEGEEYTLIHNFQTPVEGVWHSFKMNVNGNY